MNNDYFKLDINVSVLFQARDSELHTWRVMNLCRGVGSILGWIIVSLKPSTDRLTKNLEKADENIIGLSEPVEMIRSNGV